MKILSFLTLGIVLLVTSCGGDNTSTNTTTNTTSYNTSLTSLDTTKNKIEEILSQYYDCNSITFKSDVLFYYKDKNNLIYPIQEFETIAKYTENRFTFDSYFKGTSTIYSTFYLEKNELGFVMYKSLNVKNEIQSKLAYNTSGNPLRWSDSIYKNDYLKYIDYNDLTKINETKYLLTSSDSLTWLSDVASSATNTSTLTKDNIESGTFEFDFENKSMSLIIQEKESDDVYENYLYGRTITINFINVGNTIINDFSVHSHSDDNNSLINSIDKLKNNNEFCYTLNYINSNNVKSKQQYVYLNENNIFSISYDDELNETYSGYHKYNEKVYSFNSTTLSELIGYESEYTISSLLPTFDVSGDLFTYIKEEDNLKVYQISDISEILDYFTIDSSLSSSYYSGNNEYIEFFVNSDDEIEKIIIPTLLGSTSSEVEYGYFEIIYSSFNSTELSNLLNGFKLSSEIEIISSWEDTRLNITNYTPISMFSNVSECLNYYLTSTESITFFLPNSIKSYEEISFDDEINMLGLYSNNCCLEEELESINAILLNDNFSYDSKNLIYTKQFTNIIVDISIMNEKNTGFSVEFYFYTE